MPSFHLADAQAAPLPGDRHSGDRSPIAAAAAANAAPLLLPVLLQLLASCPASCCWSERDAAAAVREVAPPQQRGLRRCTTLKGNVGGSSAAVPEYPYHKP